jgi:hypothetical protein
MRLELTANLSKITTILNGIEDKNNSTLFYSFDINLEGTYEDGEYTYRLFDGDELKATGLLQIGDYKRDTDINKEYNDNKKGYIVYGE